MLKRRTGSLTMFAVVTTSLGAAAARSRLTRAVTLDVEPSPPAGTAWKQSGCSNSPGPAVTGMTTRNGDPNADCALASPSTMPCAAEDAIRVATSSAVMVAKNKRHGACVDSAALDRAPCLDACMCLHRLVSGPPGRYRSNKSNFHASFHGVRADGLR